MTARLLRWAAWFALAASCLVFALGAVARLSGFEVWDDGLMFSRYAENLARDGQVAWNPAELGGEPTWGLTSLGHLVVVSLARAVLRPVGGDALAWAVASSWLMGWVFLGLMLWAAWRYPPLEAPEVGADDRSDDDRSDGDRSLRLGLVAWTALCLAAGFRSVGAHFGTGMDTMTALVWLTAFLFLARRTEMRLAQSDDRRDDRRVGAWITLFAAFTFFVRPDALILPAAVLAAFVLFAPGGKRILVHCAVSAPALVALWLVTGNLLGSRLPLPFYAKSGGGHYGDAFAAHYEGVAGLELGLFAVAFWIPIFAIAFELLVQPLRWWRESAAVDKGLVVGVVAFAVYHLTQVAPIMGGGQRFYQPLLPALLWLSWGSVLRLRGCFARRKAALAMAALLAGVMLFHAVSGEWMRLRTALSRATWPTLNLESAYEARASGYWPALDEVAKLPPSTMIAATEVGLPGVMNPRKVVVDLAGLHDPDFARNEFSTELVFGGPYGPQRRPDVLYLPHPHYESMLHQLMWSPVVREEYTTWTANELGSLLGVAVLRGSPAEAALAAPLDAMTETAKSR